MTDLTIKVLIEIRDEIRELRQDTNVRFERVERRFEGMEMRQAESEVRIATEIVAVASAVHELKDAFLEERRLTARVDDHEQRLQALERSDKH